MLRKIFIFSTIMLSLFSVLTSISSAQGYAFLCAYTDTLYSPKCSFLRSSIDTSRVLAIYCTGYTQPGKLPSFWASMWADSGLSVSGFFNDNSYGKYILHCDPKVDSVNGQPCPFKHPSLAPAGGYCNGGGQTFADSIFLMVDSVVNFADYDQDQDGIVDGFFFIILATHWTGCPCLGEFSAKIQYASSPLC
jgi:hypothetical protein